VELPLEWATELSAMLLQARDSPRDGIVAESSRRDRFVLGSVSFRVRVICKSDRIVLKVRSLVTIPIRVRTTYQTVEFDRSLLEQLSELVAQASVSRSGG
jgi:hypothetical protein